MVRVAAFQGKPRSKFNENILQIIENLKSADREQIDFICFPEGFLTGYHAEKEIAEQTALEITSSKFQSFLNQIACFNLTIIIGFNEKEDDKIFDSAAVIEQGKLIGIQRKHYLYHHYFTSDHHYSIFQSKGIQFGVVICLDSNYFEPSRLLALQGATILFTPMCNKVPLDHPFIQRPPYYSQFVARTHENRCWLVGADWIWSNDGQFFCPGHSVIYDSDGREVVRSRECRQDLIVADIPPNRLFYEKGRRMHGSPILTQQLVKFLS
jgi:predicted amidohydrolase